MPVKLKKSIFLKFLSDTCLVLWVRRAYISHFGLQSPETISNQLYIRESVFPIGMHVCYQLPKTVSTNDCQNGHFLMAISVKTQLKSKNTRKNVLLAVWRVSLPLGRKLQRTVELKFHGDFQG